MAPELKTQLGDLVLRSPLVAASGTVGSVWEWAEVANVSPYGAAVAKSVAPVEWPGRRHPRLAPTSVGMLNGVGIQNPGIEAWVSQMTSKVPRLRVPVWGSAVADDPEGFGLVAKGLAGAGVKAIEVNLSCPNLDDGLMFSFSDDASARVISAVAGTVDVPVGAKLSPNTPDIVGVAESCVTAGADFLVLTNTVLGFGVSIADRKPQLSGGVGGYSGPGMKPIALRCVFEVSRAIPEVPIVGCGGVVNGADVAEYLIAGASAVEVGTALLAEPNAGVRIVDEFSAVMERLGAQRASDLVGTLDEW